MVIAPIHLSGEHADAIAEGKAMPLAVLVYYPDEDKLATVGMDTVTAGETRAIMEKFIEWRKV